MIFENFFYIVYFLYHQIYKIFMSTLQQLGFIDDTNTLNPQYWQSKWNTTFWVDGRGKLIKKAKTGVTVPDFADTNCSGNTKSKCLEEAQKVAQTYVRTIGSKNLIKKKNQADKIGMEHKINASTDLVSGGAYSQKLGLWSVQDLASSLISRKILNWQILLVFLFYLANPLLNIFKQGRNFLKNAGIGGNRVTFR